MVTVVTYDDSSGQLRIWDYMKVPDPLYAIPYAHGDLRNQPLASESDMQPAPRLGSLLAEHSRLIETAVEARIGESRLELLNELCQEASTIGSTSPRAHDVVGGAFAELSMLLSNTNRSGFPSGDRFQLVLDVLSMINDPGQTILQGLRNTTAAATALFVLARSRPDSIANLVRQVATTGTYHLPTGERVFLNQFSLRPAEDRFLPESDIPRFANHVLQYTLSNLIVQVRFGSDCRYVRVRVISPKDTGERVINARTGQVLLARDGAIYWSSFECDIANINVLEGSTLTAMDAVTLTQIITSPAGQAVPHHVLVHRDLDVVDGLSSSGAMVVSSMEEFQARLSQMAFNGATYSIVVRLEGSVFDQGILSSGAVQRYHLVSAWSHDRDAVTIFNPWSGNQVMSLIELYDAMRAHGMPPRVLNTRRDNATYPIFYHVQAQS